MIKLIAICKYKKFHIHILGLLCLCFSQSVYAENSLQKSLLELKKAIQEMSQKTSDSGSQSSKIETSEHNANIEDVFGIKAPKQQPEIKNLWKNKAELFNAISENKIPKLWYGMERQLKLEVVSSIALILAVDYKTPVLVDGIEKNMCEHEFLNVPQLIGLITESKLMKLGNNPPNFIGNDDVENNNSEGRRLFANLKNACTMANGSKAVYPFVNSLSMLLKEYSDLTELHVEKMRLEKIESYKLTEEKAKVAKVEKDLADSEAKVLENQASEKLRRDRHFQDEFNRKEEARKRQCLSSIEYVRFVSATAVQENLSRVKSAKDSILKEKEIGKVSGYENASKLNELGRIQIFAQDNANSAYKDYRKNGGKATLPSGVVSGKNPCL